MYSDIRNILAMSDVIVWILSAIGYVFIALVLLLLIITIFIWLLAKYGQHMQDKENKLKRDSLMSEIKLRNLKK